MAGNDNLQSNAIYGWFRGFQKRFNIKRINFHGEAGSANLETVDNWLSTLKGILEDFSPDDVYNIDETGLFYQQQRSIKDVVILVESINLERSYVTSFETNQRTE